MNSKRKQWLSGVLLIVAVYQGFVMIWGEMSRMSFIDALPLAPLDPGTTANQGPEVPGAITQESVETRIYLIPETPVVGITERLLASFGEQSRVHPLNNCSVTSQVQLEVQIDQGTQHQQWKLRSFSNDGSRKNIGGDEFYVTYMDYVDPHNGTPTKDPSAVAIPRDIGNGEYLLEFFIPPMREGQSFNASGVGYLTVHFQYTCFIGSWDCSQKRYWVNNGASRVHHVLDNVPSPPMKQYSFPSRNVIDISKLHHVICYGDSLINDFCAIERYWNRFHKTKPILHAGRYRKDYSTDTVDEILAGLDEIQASIRDNNPPSNNTPRTAIILGSHAWDILHPRGDLQNIQFDDHIEAIRKVVTMVKDRYPNDTLLWKSPQSFHVHILDPSCYEQEACSIRTLHMSSHWTKLLYERQTKLMTELGISMIDIYESTYLSAAHSKPRDGRHYERDLNWELFKAMEGLT